MSLLTVYVGTILDVATPQHREYFRFAQNAFVPFLDAMRERTNPLAVTIRRVKHDLIFRIYRMVTAEDLKHQGSLIILEPDEEVYYVVGMSLVYPPPDYFLSTRAPYLEGVYGLTANEVFLLQNSGVNMSNDTDKAKYS